MRIIKDSTPSADGFRMPAEYEKHEGCIMIFPERSDSWQYGGYAARKAFVKVAEAIAGSEKVTVCASGRQYDNARSMLSERIRVVEMSSNDAWARDYCPTFVKNDRGEIRGIDWGFNAWGGLFDGLYFPWDQDNQMARKLCDLMNQDVYDKRDFILEGGSIHVDGQGTCLVTESCLLSKGRNPELDRVEIEKILCDYLNVSKILWLPSGIYGDETNEHVDNICAFTAPGEVVLAWTEDVTDVQYDMSKACLEYLESATDAKGRSIRVHKLPLPKPVTMTAQECDGLDACWGEATRTPGERLAASYVNFYIANHSIVMPGFGDPSDEKAKMILSDLFPNREVIQIYARDILIGGGNIHCITQQIPTSGRDMEWVKAPKEAHPLVQSRSD
ncbi:MAG: agmatine deiminase [Lachnospiraceae bacterium]|nr:agmatine deiminase [Lachnospiraceae bacterium]